MLKEITKILIPKDRRTDSNGIIPPAVCNLIKNILNESKRFKKEKKRI